MARLISYEIILENDQPLPIVKGIMQVGGREAWFKFVIPEELALEENKSDLYSVIMQRVEPITPDQVIGWEDAQWLRKNGHKGSGNGSQPI